MTTFSDWLEGETHNGNLKWNGSWASNIKRDEENVMNGVKKHALVLKNALIIVLFLMKAVLF